MNDVIYRELKVCANKLNFIKWRFVN